MREMKDSGVEWIGEIPREWTIYPLNQYFAERKSKNIDNSETNILSLSYGRIVKRDVTDNMGLLPESFSTYNIVEPDNIVLRLTDLQNDQKSLRTGLVTQRGIITSAYLTLEAKTISDCRYNHYLLHIYDVMKIIYNMGNGVRQNLKYAELSKLPIIVPAIEEQSHIANYLNVKCTQIDAIIARQQEIIEKLKAYKLSVITEAVTKGLNPDVPMKDSGVVWIGKIPQSWRIAQLKFFANIRSGITLGKKYGSEVFLNEYPYLRVANVQGDHTDLSDVATIWAMPEEAQKYQLHSGELLMTEGGDRDKLGRGCVWQGEIPLCLHQNHVYAVATDDNCLSVYFLDYMTTSDVARSYFDYTAKKTTNLASTNSTTILQFKLPFPPRKEQDEIVANLNSKCQKLNDFVTKKQLIIDKLTEYKKSLIYEVVTGKKEV